jgi:hypothetical protein
VLITPRGRARDWSPASKRLIASIWRSGVPPSAPERPSDPGDSTTMSCPSARRRAAEHGQKTMDRRTVAGRSESELNDGEQVGTLRAHSQPTLDRDDGHVRRPVAHRRGRVRPPGESAARRAIELKVEDARAMARTAHRGLSGTERRSVWCPRGRVGAGLWWGLCPRGNGSSRDRAVGSDRVVLPSARPQ